MISMSGHEIGCSSQNISVCEPPVNKNRREVEDFPQAWDLECVDFVQHGFCKMNRFQVSKPYNNLARITASKILSFHFTFASDAFQ